MIQSESCLSCADNTGVKTLKCIKVLGGSKRRYARVGDLIVCSVKEAIPSSKIKKGEVVRALIIRQKFSFKRSCGSVVRADNNAAVILDKDLPVGTRINGVVFSSKVIRAKYSKVISLSTGGAI